VTRRARLTSDSPKTERKFLDHSELLESEAVSYGYYGYSNSYYRNYKSYYSPAARK